LLLTGIIILAIVLRFYQIANVPPGLYIDEASIGYNAYTILINGVDEHSVPYPVWFRSFGEYKMPVYIYLTTFVMAVAGKSEIAVRFTAAFFGVLTVPLVYFFVRKLMMLEKKQFSRELQKSLPLLAGFLLAVTPWHIQFSRAGFEVTVAVFLYLGASYLFLFFLERKQVRYLYASILMFILTMYTYHSFRVITPLSLIVLFLFLAFSKYISRKNLLITMIITGLLIFPIAEFSLTKKGSERFSQTSAFSEYPVHSWSEMLLVYPMIYLKNYIAFFSPHFLFNFGDGIGRHQIPGFGLLFRWEFPFLIAGFSAMIKTRKSLLTKLLLLMVFLAPIPAALVRPSPHSLRSLLMVLPFTIIIAFGIMSVAHAMKGKFRWILLLFIPIALFESAFYLHYYYVHYPKVNLLDWGGANKAMVMQAQKYRTTKPIIVVENTIPFAFDYFRFYDPSFKVITVGNDWQIPKNIDKSKILLIRPYYGKETDPNMLETVYLPNINHDIYSQFWKIPE
jgi:hypothetical protein